MEYKIIVAIWQTYKWMTVFAWTVILVMSMFGTVTIEWTRN
jgi:uncharacterized membrane protein YqjE